MCQTHPYLAYLPLYYCYFSPHSKHTHVVDVTEDRKAQNNNVRPDMYVIEDAGIDDIVIWQDSKGAIYRTQGNSEPLKTYDSLERYILGAS